VTRLHRNARPLRAAALALGAALLTGCPPSPMNSGLDDGEPPVVEPTPPYEPLRTAYNARLAEVKQMWARTVVEITWFDADGKRHWEQGDGPIMIRIPHEIGLSIGKAGSTMFWIGADAERFWLFDLKPPEGQPSTAIVGRHADLASPDAPRLNLPVAPGRLIDLMGLSPLPESDAVVVASHTPEADGPRLLRVVLPAHDPADPSLRRVIDIDPKTHRATRIAFVNDAGVVIEADLSAYEPLRLDGRPPGAFPHVPTLIDIHAPQRPGQPNSQAAMKLALSEMTDAKIADAQFDFEALVQGLRPQRVEPLQPESP